jgi:SAM-dependent methyltransferase
LGACVSLYIRMPASKRTSRPRHRIRRRIWHVCFIKSSGNHRGVDISEEAVDHAKGKYQLDYRVGNAEKIPVESGTIDAVVSFETIEHVPNPVSFLNEISRILKPQGIVILSTPNKDIYHHDQTPNPYHCSEMTLPELHAILAEQFQVEEVFGQTYPEGCGLDRLQRSITRVSYTLGLWTRWVLEKTVVALFAPRIDTSDPVERLKIVNSIPTLTRPFEGFWNPYRIERISTPQPREPTYFLTIARKSDFAERERAV